MNLPETARAPTLNFVSLPDVRAPIHQPIITKTCFPLSQINEKNGNMFSAIVFRHTFLHSKKITNNHLKENTKGMVHQKIPTGLFQNIGSTKSHTKCFNTKTHRNMFQLKVIDNSKTSFDFIFTRNLPTQEIKTKHNFLRRFLICFSNFELCHVLAKMMEVPFPALSGPTLLFFKKNQNYKFSRSWWFKKMTIQ